MSGLIKAARGSLTSRVVIITKPPTHNPAMLRRGDRLVIVVDEQTEDRLVIAENLAFPKYRIYLSPDNFELAPLESGA